MTTILDLRASLRTDSFNRRLAGSITAALPEDLVLDEFDLATIPYFNEDDEADPAGSIIAFREAIEAASVVLISTPEYNGSMPGLLKNALDWASRPHRRGAFVDKPVAVVSASPSPGGGRRAHAQVVELLTSAGAQVLPTTVNIARAHETLTQHGDQIDEVAAAITAAARVSDAAGQLAQS